MMFFLPMAALIAGGCTPPVGGGTGNVTAPASGNVTAPAPANTTAPRAAPNQHAPGECPRCKGAAETAAKAAAKDEPVLYDSGYMEDNQSCLVCHLDFQNEEITTVHLDAGLTCAACHGDSEAHRGDEWNVVRPDVIWGRAEMAAFCKQCHPKHKTGKAYDEFRAEWLDKRRVTGRYVTEDSACTDCHGKHAIIIGENEFK